MLSVPETEKQPWESFVIAGEFTNNMTASETITLGSSSVTIVDANGEDKTADMISSPQVISRTKLAARLSGGTADLSPYKVTFKILTSDLNKWEKDVQIRVLDL